MPSRLVCLVIVVFWLACTSLLIVREILPRFQLGSAPPFALDIGDEFLDSRDAGWLWYMKSGEDVMLLGRVLVRTEPIPGTTFYKLVNEWQDSITLSGVKFQHVRFHYKINRRGQILWMDVSGSAAVSVWPNPLPFRLRAEVKDDRLEIEVVSDLLGHSRLPPMELEEPPQLNSMELLSRLPGLRLNQTWRVTHVDLMSVVNNIVKPDRLCQSHLVAKVTRNSLEEDLQGEPCHTVEYRDARGQLHARTWVRIPDGLVLKQWAVFQGQEMWFERDPKDRQGS